MRTLYSDDGKGTVQRLQQGDDGKRESESEGKGNNSDDGKGKGEGDEAA